MPFEAGTTLGRFEIRSKFGAGGMGDVYLAQDTKLDRKHRASYGSPSFHRHGYFGVSFFHKTCWSLQLSKW